MLTVHLPVVLEQDEDGLFVATIPNLRGCHTQGRTVSEAMARIKEAAELVLEEMDEDSRRAFESTFVGFREVEICLP